MICTLQDKDSEISTYKTQEILVEKLRRKQELEIKSLKIELRKVCLTKFEFEKDLFITQKGESCTKSSTAKIPCGWWEFKSTDGRQYIWSEQIGRRSQENRRRSNKTTPRKDRNLSKARIEDPLY